MLEGDVVTDGWRSAAVKEALDLCLSCKACRTECPVGVDMARYKAEFLARYYRGRLRPAAAWSMGLFDRWSRLAARLPGAVNLLTHAPALRTILKRVAGVAPERDIPRFARETFVRSAVRRRAQGGGPPVVLWPDTFNNHLHPEVLHAAVDVLEDAGYSVLVPTSAPCCGRPLYDFGMLTAARRRLRGLLRLLADPVRDAVPVVVLEPSCLAVFRDELLAMLPDDPAVPALSRLAVSLAELLTRDGYRPRGGAGRQVLVHGHCHQKALSGMDADAALLSAAGYDVRILDAGCCGMAGAFGFERGHYAVSMKIGELALLPAVREAGTDTLFVADGFSCREQIAHATGRRALHIAELLRRGIGRG
jgi:Fe-S oxidoreductase